MGKPLKLLALIAVVIAVMAAAVWYWLPMTATGTRVVISRESIGMRGYTSRIVLFGSGLVAVRSGGGEETIWLQAARSRYSWVPAGDVDRVLSALDAARFFDLRTEYTDPERTDTGFVTICVYFGDRHRCVLHDLGDPSAPAGLTDLEDLIPSVADVSR